MTRLLFASIAMAIAAPMTFAADDYGTIKGQVKLPNAPKAEEITVSQDKEKCCPNGKALISSIIQVDPKSSGLKNVIVWLRPDDTDRKKTFPIEKIHADLKTPKAAKHVIDQPKCQFEPRVLAARAGDTIVIKNSAEISHNVNYASEKESFNVTLPPGKEYELKNPLDAERLPIAFKCDIHPWMAGRLRVFDHPYYATTDAEGKFELKQVPAGKWRLVYWHENGFHKGKDGLLGFPVEVTGGKESKVELDFEFPPKS